MHSTQHCPTVRPARCGAVLLLSLFLSPAAQADDWPQWLGPQRDDIWRETGIIEKFPAAGPTVRWRAPLGGGYTGPAVADGRVYVMDRQLPADAKPAPAAQTGFMKRTQKPGSERVLCLNEADGKLLWKHEYDCPYTVQYDSGPRTTPLVHDHNVYTVGAEGNLFCLDTDQGKVIWSHDFKKDYEAKTQIWGFAGHPLLDGQKLICMVGGKDSTVVAFDKDTGKEIWKALSAQSLGYCPPMIYEAGGKRQLIIWHGEAICGLDPETGNVYWTQPYKAYMGMAIASPRKWSDDLFVTSTFGNSMMLNLASEKPGATVAWKGDGKISFDSVFATPFFENGYVYGTSSNGELCCIEAATGKRQWATFEPNSTKKVVRSADIFITKNGDRFFLFTEKGDLIIARLTPKSYEEISRAHLLEPTTEAFGRKVVWSHPAYANRSAFMRNDKEIICVSLADSAGAK
jgi:outer membrane protein assembly factor BamB